MFMLKHKLTSFVCHNVGSHDLCFALWNFR